MVGDDPFALVKMQLGVVSGAGMVINGNIEIRFATQGVLLRAEGKALAGQWAG
jgi:hypothetical protein